MSLESLKKLVVEIETTQEEIKRQAQLEVDHYWQVFKFNNKRKPLQDVGHHAPRIRSYKNTGSINIMWEHWPYRKDKSKRITNLIKGTQRGYKRNSFRNVKDWEWELIQSTESHLEPLRNQLKELQSVKVRINKLIKKANIHQEG